MNTEMITAIVIRTPTWVWGLLAVLVAVGLSQAWPRQVGLRRVALLPLALLALSLLSVVTGFRADSTALLFALAGWGAGVAGAMVAGRALVAPHGAHWLAASQRLQVPGSWLPLALMVGLFLVKYAAGVSFAMHPLWAAQAPVAAPVGLVYGTFSGLFLARAAALWSLARQPRRQHAG